MGWQVGWSQFLACLLQVSSGYDPAFLGLQSWSWGLGVGGRRGGPTGRGPGELTEGG